MRQSQARPLVEVLYDAWESKKLSGRLNKLSLTTIEHRIESLSNILCPSIKVRMFDDRTSVKCHEHTNHVASRVSRALNAAVSARTHKPYQFATKAAFYRTINAALRETGYRPLVIRELERRCPACQRYIDPDMLNEVITRCEAANPTRGVFVRLLARTGLRLSEAMSLRKDCLSTIAGQHVVVVRHMLSSTTKTHMQMIPVTDEAIINAIPKIKDHGWGFSSDAIRCWMRAHGKKCGVDLTPHCLRRTWKCMMTRYSERVRHIPDAALKICMGHALDVHERYQSESWLGMCGKLIAHAASNPPEANL